MLRRIPIFFLLLAIVVLPTALQAQNRPKRKLAPGVLTTIPAQLRSGETLTGPMPLESITVGMKALAFTPNFAPKSDTLIERAKNVVLRRSIYCLEFSFKPLRMVRVDVPQTNGRMRKKLIWYLVYSVKYSTPDLHPKAVKGPFTAEYGQSTKFPETEPIVDDKGKRFFPSATLVSHDYKKRYLDRVIPNAVKDIQVRETRGSKLYNSVEMTAQTVPYSAEGEDKTVWGVFTWEDIDPRTDYLSIYIRGLSNSYRITADKKLTYKTLELNFWRPGDADDEHENEIRYGVPHERNQARFVKILKLYGTQKPLEYRWLYR